MTTYIEKPYAITDLKMYITLIFDLDPLNYASWCGLFETRCNGFNMSDHLQEANDKTSATSDNAQWNQVDSIVKMWIYRTIYSRLL